MTTRNLEISPTTTKVRPKSWVEGGTLGTSPVKDFISPRKERPKSLLTTNALPNHIPPEVSLFILHT